jgi:magnesium transporter
MNDTPQTRRKKPGTSPGSLILNSPKRVPQVQLQTFEFSPNFFHEEPQASLDKILELKTSPHQSWMNIDGLHDVELIQKIGAHFEIHPLNLEDILEPSSRPKIDEMEDYIFMSFKMISFGKKSGNGEKLLQEQVSLVLGQNWVLSFQEVPGDSFDPVRERLRSGKGRMRRMGADYFAYALIDAAVDYYFVAVEQIGERLDAIDKKVLDSPSPAILKQIHSLKNDLIKVRKAIWPLRDVISSLERNDSKLIRPETLIFIRDLHDHIVQLIEAVETYRDLVGGLFDIYLSSQSNRTNEIIRVLTVTTSIFIPLTFIVGIYGMNFKFFPELEWHYGYHLVWALMITVAIGMVSFFRKRGWI